MKYFSFSSWHREQTGLIEEISKEYAEEFKTIQNYLSNDFLDVYRENHGFHDFRIKNIDFGDSHNVILKIYRNKGNHFLCRKKEYYILYSGVIEFKVYFWDTDHFKSMQIGKDMEWGYDEFSRDENGLCHSILTSSGKEITIWFKSIDVISPLRTTASSRSR